MKELLLRKAKSNEIDLYNLLNNHSLRIKHAASDIRDIMGDVVWQVEEVDGDISDESARNVAAFMQNIIEYLNTTDCVLNDLYQLIGEWSVTILHLGIDEEPADRDDDEATVEADSVDDTSARSDGE